MSFQHDLRRIIEDPWLADDEKQRALTRLIGDLIGPDRAMTGAHAPDPAQVRGYNEAKEAARERLYR